MKAKPTKEPGGMVLEMDRSDEPLMAAASRATPAPFRLKQILVPIDFSDCAKKALRYAIPLAKEHEAEITLLYVMPTDYAVGEYGGIDYAALEAETRATEERELAILAVDEVRGEVPADTLVRSGSPAFEIIEAAKALPADVIVISTHGRTGLKHMLLGSVTEHVVCRAPCPVLVVREDEREFIAGSVEA
jgi:universal stress protein A